MQKYFKREQEKHQVSELLKCELVYLTMALGSQVSQYTSARCTTNTALRSWIVGDSKNGILSLPLPCNDFLHFSSKFYSR